MESDRAELSRDIIRIESVCAVTKPTRNPPTMKEFLAREQAERQATRQELARSLSAEEYHRQQQLEEFREVGRGIGEALAANLPSETIAAALKAAGLGD